MSAKFAARSRTAAGGPVSRGRRDSFLLALIFLLSSCASDPQSPADAVPSDYYHWSEAETDRPAGWVVILPGSSGLTVFDDDRHYFDTANRYNELGFDVLVVDYKPAVRASANAPESASPGEKIEWITERAIEWMWHEHPRTRTRQGVIAAWSLGAEGAMRLVNDDRKTKSLQIGSAVFFYPTNFEQVELDNQVPLLILIGDKDDVTPAAAARAMVESRSAGAAQVDLVVYPGAHHGFDIESLTMPRTVRLLPLFGPSATFFYDANAAREADQRVSAFLTENQ